MQIDSLLSGEGGLSRALRGSGTSAGVTHIFTGGSKPPSIDIAGSIGFIIVIA